MKVTMSRNAELESNPKVATPSWHGQLLLSNLKTKTAGSVWSRTKATLHLFQPRITDFGS